MCKRLYLTLGLTTLTAGTLTLTFLFGSTTSRQQPARRISQPAPAPSIEGGRNGRSAAVDPAHEGAEERPDSPAEAAEFRYFQRRSENGTVPANAVMIARADRAAMMQAGG